MPDLSHSEDSALIANRIVLGSNVEAMVGRLVDLVRDFSQHDSVRCGWPAGYGQWKVGDCACGLTEALRDAGLPVEWAGGPPND